MYEFFIGIVERLDLLAGFVQNIKPAEWALPQYNLALNKQAVQVFKVPECEIVIVC